MALTLADQYYLKSLDNYNYNWEESLRDLNYALSHDPEHAGANNLMGRLQMEHFKNFELAEEYFIQAMVANPFHIQTCMDYLRLLLKKNEVKAFDKLMKHTLSIQGTDQAEVFQLKAQQLELNQQFEQAVKVLNQAKMLTTDDCLIEELEDGLSRISNKTNSLQTIYYMTD